MQLWLPLLAASALALETTPNANATEAATIEEFPPSQWGIQRATEREGRPGTIIVTRHDAWLTMWGSGTVTTDRKMDAGNRAWTVFPSHLNDGNDMIQSMQTGQCLDAYWDNGAGRPLVHGWSCDRANNNQYWSYSSWSTTTMIKHKKWGGWCLAGEADKGHPWMEQCNYDDERQTWNFVS
ncbi:hypothetical protein ACHHYP_05886 [Achlya hypogyna]|uniref:Secreted protein n=1 Tax=Achlya hypogyna TaxID=1202772 RepID=A0A0A7CNP4_ACHHY|nr:secreted protein [Achlya hypogyna]OQR89997.1 hypothetical protein ACHHYP_05886 [Achlya hypogyna]